MLVAHSFVRSHTLFQHVLISSTKRGRSRYTSATLAFAADGTGMLLSFILLTSHMYFGKGLEQQPSVRKRSLVSVKTASLYVSAFRLLPCHRPRVDKNLGTHWRLRLCPVMFITTFCAKTPARYCQDRAFVGESAAGARPSQINKLTCEHVQAMSNLVTKASERLSPSPTHRS